MQCLFDRVLKNPHKISLSSLGCRQPVNVGGRAAGRKEPPMGGARHGARTCSKRAAPEVRKIRSAAARTWRAVCSGRPLLGQRRKTGSNSQNYCNPQRGTLESAHAGGGPGSGVGAGGGLSGRRTAAGIGALFERTASKGRSRGRKAIFTAADERSSPIANRPRNAMVCPTSTHISDTTLPRRPPPYRNAIVLTPEMSNGRRQRGFLQDALSSSKTM